MTVKINNKEYVIHIGIKCLEYLDTVYCAEESGIKVGMGVELVTVGLTMRNPVAVYHMIKGGTATEKSKPSNADIESFIESAAEAEEDDFEVLCEDFLSALEKAPLAKKKMEALSQLTTSPTES